LFADKGCVQCHAIGAVGGKVGPDLADLGVRRSPTEFAAAMWNKAPAMLTAAQGKGIPAPTLTPAEMADLVAYLYSVRYFGDAGEVQRGWAVAAAKGCLTCHGIAGERGKSAGDLSRYPSTATPPGVLSALWNHALVTAREPGGKPGAWPAISPEEMRHLTAVLMTIGRGTRP
jgi:mono/diheme cytochrome c family protein